MLRFFLLTILTFPLLLLGETEDSLDMDDDIASHLNITNHSIELESGLLEYTAITGKCPVFNKGKEKTAELFFIAYIKDGEKDRPLTFIFPGGPGGPATIESICSIGPRRILTPDEGRTIFPPFEMIDNKETLLDHTDLIFIDPVDCGFSESTPEANLNYFYSVQGDIQTLGECIYTCIHSLERWNSPIYLGGTSYGSLRAGALALNLLQYDIAAKGIILNGCALDYSLLETRRDQSLPDCLLIPTLAATAWHHGRFWPEKSLDEVLEYARHFALDIYASVMMKPSRLNLAEKLMFEEQLAELIGLPIETVQRYNCRIDESIYKSEFFRNERKVLGGPDTRYSREVYSINPANSGDPSYDDCIGLVPALKNYLQKELDTDYKFARYKWSTDLICRWNFDTYDSDLPDIFQRIRKVMAIHPRLKVFVGSGYYDCRTPFAATEYCFDHLDLPLSFRDNIQFEYYQAGHGFFFDLPSLKKYKSDLVKFYER